MRGTHFPSSSQLHSVNQGTDWTDKSLLVTTYWYYQLLGTKQHHHCRRKHCLSKVQLKISARQLPRWPQADLFTYQIRYYLLWLPLLGCSRHHFHHFYSLSLLSLSSSSFSSFLFLSLSLSLSLFPLLSSLTRFLFPQVFLYLYLSLPGGQRLAVDSAAPSMSYKHR